MGQGSTLNLRFGEHCLARTFCCLEINSIEWALSEQCMSTEISEINLSVNWNKLYWWKFGSATGFLSGHLSQYSFTLFYFIKIFKSHCRSFRKVNKREKGELHYLVQKGTIEEREQVSLRCERSLGLLKPSMQYAKLLTIQLLPTQVVPYFYF